MGETTHQCSQCGVVKPVTAFYVRQRKSGYVCYSERIACNRIKRGRTPLERRVRRTFRKTKEGKECRRCGKFLAYVEFSNLNTRYSRDGKQSSCKRCQFLCYKEYMKTDRGKQTKANGDRRFRNSLIVGTDKWWKVRYGYNRVKCAFPGVDWTALRDLYNKSPFCRYCLVGLNPDEVQFDHRQPRSRGGTVDFANLCVACPACNRLKWNMTEEEFRKFQFEYAQRIIEPRGLRVVEGA